MDPVRCAVLVFTCVPDVSLVVVHGLGGDLGLSGLIIIDVTVPRPPLWGVC